MSTNIDFKDLWQKQSVSQPDIEDLFTKLKQFKKSNMRNLIKLNILLLTTCVFIVFVWAYFKPQFITTKIGIILIIAAISIYLFSLNKQAPIFNKIDNGLPNNEYLQTLITLKHKQQFLQTTMLNLYFIILSAGMCLYMYEYTARMTTLWAIFAYTITSAWIIFNWLYIKPKTVKKQQSKLNDLIAEFEHIADQFKTEK